MLHRIKSWPVSTLLYITIGFICVMMAFPFFWMFSSSLKTNDEIWSVPPVLWPAEAKWTNFAEAWQAAPFGLYLFNSIFVAVAIVIIQLINSSMISYALTHMRFALSRVIMAMIMVTYMLPVSATYLSSYVILARLGLLDSYTGLIVSNAISIFGIFLLRQAFLQVPKELVEAAKIDGSGHWRILWTIMIPLSRSTLVVMTLLSFIGQYNNYLWPMLITKSPRLHLVSAGLRSFFVEGGAYGMKWPLIMAASTLTILPLVILFLVAQKWIIKGVSNAHSVNKG
ncbi:L-arabinose transport system permease protein AraQ [Paenibacillus sp. CECT 9249]|uniref:carbohydrate ABC transporter permease n=1 Tax=Paenibacillus sp. CECT 9249 TaxID=2845385 RepID=UPI001E3EE271|nr:carbohydrate ABC transporter permease [Paenibacillus sp. CECT 9249]CAH0122404.1 L-arabinose transport system permease protein AraQ [Paenibacillus sp. CECT 9249]